jgi:Flp pilus assembly protein TadG
MRTNQQTTIRRQRRRGAAAIEFGYWLLPLAIIVSGLVDLGWYMSRYHMVQRATMDGVRYGIRFGSEEEQGVDVQGSVQTTVAEDRANVLLNGFGLSGTPAATFHPDSPYDMLRMTVTVPYQPLVGILPMPANITARFEMMAEKQWCNEGEACP